MNKGDVQGIDWDGETRRERVSCDGRELETDEVESVALKRTNIKIQKITTVELLVTVERAIIISFAQCFDTLHCRQIFN